MEGDVREAAFASKARSQSRSFHRSETAISYEQPTQAAVRTVTPSGFTQQTEKGLGS